MYKRNRSATSSIILVTAVFFSTFGHQSQYRYKGMASLIGNYTRVYAHRSALETIQRTVVPRLTNHLHKGEMGRIGIIGGSPEYTGAPFYAGISSLKVGADLCFIFSAMEASGPIKSYSPELMVVPIYSKQEMPNFSAEDIPSKIFSHLKRIHALVLGPGLGRDESVHTSVGFVIMEARRLNIPMVLDADALYLISQNLDLVQGYQLATLTPNIVEYKRLRAAVTKELVCPSDKWPDVNEVMETARLLGNPIIVLKGEVDIITDGRDVLLSDASGSLKRTGGLGDILAGTIGVFQHWAHKHRMKSNFETLITAEIDGKIWKGDVGLWAAFGASTVVKTAAANAFNEKKRAMTAPDVIGHLGEAFESLFPLKIDKEQTS